MEVNSLVSVCLIFLRPSLLIEPAVHVAYCRECIVQIFPPTHPPTYLPRAERRLIIRTHSMGKLGLGELSFGR